ncbi:MAG: GMC family oxidoreductase N-terminal domain-containing protein [Salaquimonas sp.]
MENPDFIVVGSGSAGSVVAERLSANGRCNVLVLEAGGSDQKFFVQMPLGYGKTFFDPKVNWMYTTETDKGLGGNKDFWPRGKILGGSSSINAMVWIRGAPEDFDEWESEGNPGWGWNDMLPVFKAIEDNCDGENEYRGAGGPLYISSIEDQVHPLTQTFLDACGEIQLGRNPDFNGAKQEGAGIWQLSTKNGRRNSAARAFLRPAMKRKNVRVITNAQVSKILFEGTRAVGVRYKRGSEYHEVKAKREIILSGGSVNSPQLLQLSGVGPSDLLKSFDIDVVVGNSNVGANLQDHQGINYTYRSNRKTLNDILRPWWGKLMVGFQYLAMGDGPLSLSINHGGGFFKTNEQFDRPNMQLYFQAFSTVIPRVGERPILSPDPFSGFSIGLSNCRTLSRGEIMIRSADPFVHPTIVGNAFSAQRDVDEMLDAVKYIRKIADAPSMRAVIEEEVLPGSQCKSDEELIEDFRKRSGTVYHPVSTCRMGPDPQSSVVDSQLKVHGVEGLRVIDASIFPNIVTGNTNAAAIATGWKGAQLVLEDHQ